MENLTGNSDVTMDRYSLTLELCDFMGEQMVAFDLIRPDLDEASWTEFAKACNTRPDDPDYTRHIYTFRNTFTLDEIRQVIGCLYSLSIQGIYLKRMMSPKGVGTNAVVILRQDVHPPKNEYYDFSATSNALPFRVIGHRLTT